MIWTIIFLFLVGVALPIMAWTSYRATSVINPDDIRLPSLSAIAMQTMAIHIVVLVLALAVAASTGISPSWYLPPGAKAIAVALLILGIGVTIAWLEAKRPLKDTEYLRKQLRKAGITRVWMLLMVTAAIVEEYAYRGVLYLFLTEMMPSWAAALASAAVFGLAHFMQGSRGAFLSAVFALAMQYLFILSGSLFLPMLVHFLYDIAASWLSQKKADTG